MKNCKTGIVFVIMTMLIGSSFVGSMVFVNADEGEDPPYSLVFEPVYEDFSENGFPPYVPPETPEGTGNETIQLPLSMTESALSVKTNDVYTSQAAEYIKYDTPLGISPLTGDSTLSPPWDDSDSGIEIFTYGFPPHDEWATDNRYTGFSDLGCHGTCCIAQEVRTWVWAWFEGHYDCSNAGEYYVQFEINYEGIVAAANIPVGLGAGILKIESNAIFEIAGQEYGTHLIFFEDSFPLVGDYPVPGPYDEQGPFIIGYEDPIHLEPGEHEFYVQFNVFIHCLVTRIK